MGRPDCPVCGRPSDAPFVSIPSQPVHCNVLWDTAEAAISSPRGDLDLAFCRTCSHIHNVSFDESLTTYGGTYENSLHHSPVFQGYASELVASLIDRHGLRDRDIVEVGAGQGDFLEMLCAAGANRGTGFDPSHVGDAEPLEGITLVAAFYGEQFAEHPADMIVCRHVLEHIGSSGDFVTMIRRVVGDRSTVAFFEVPSALWTLEDGGIWDLIYEHCGYFTPTSLAETFRRAAFRPVRSEAVFGNQFLTIEAEPADEPIPSPDDLGARVESVGVAVERFSEMYRSEVDRWSATFAEMRVSDRRAAVWGAGSKGVTFLNTVDHGGAIDRAVDINPRKHGKFVAGSGQEIVGPDALIDDPPGVVLVMNPNYAGEISRTLAGMGIDAAVEVV